MTPDEHAAEAERIIVMLSEMADTDHPPTTADLTVNLARAQVLATLATRPTPLVEYTAALTDGPTPLTIAGYDAAVERAMNTLWKHLPSDVQEGRDPSLIRRWVEIVIDAAGASAPTTET